MKTKLPSVRFFSAVAIRFAALSLSWFAMPLFALERVSLTPSGDEVFNGVSFNPSVSADGRYVVFESNADVVPEKMSFFYDIYVRDRVLGTTTRVSVDGSGNEANGSSTSAMISADGLFVVFSSDASNLVAGDTNGVGDIFVKNMSTGVVERVSVATGGSEATSWPSNDPSISSDGRYIVFSSAASDLVGGDTNGQTDIFLRDRQTGTTTRVSLGPASAEGDGESYSPVISDDGRAVAFRSYSTTLTSPATTGNALIFVRDLVSNTTSLVSKSTGGAEADFDCSLPDLSSDGNLVIFQSEASNLDPLDTDSNSDIFLHDRQAGTTRVVSLSSGGVKGNDMSFNPAISGNGTFVGFTSDSTNLVPGDTNSLTDLFVRNVSSGVTQRISVGPKGEQGNDFTWSTPDFIADGSALAFESSASNFVANDTNMTHDIFYGSTTPPADTTAQRVLVQKQIKTATKKLKAAKRSGNKAKIKRYNKQVKKLKAKLRRL